MYKLVIIILKAFARQPQHPFPRKFFVNFEITTFQIKKTTLSDVGTMAPTNQQCYRGR